MASRTSWDKMEETPEQKKEREEKFINNLKEREIAFNKSNRLEQQRVINKISSYEDEVEHHDLDPDDIEKIQKIQKKIPSLGYEYLLGESIKKRVAALLPAKSGGRGRRRKSRSNKSRKSRTRRHRRSS